MPPNFTKLNLLGVDCVKEMLFIADPLHLWILASFAPLMQLWVMILSCVHLPD
jgi:hypothetical protein